MELKLFSHFKRANHFSNISWAGRKQKQLLHLVFGGELESLEGIEFRDLDDLDVVGIYPNYERALAAWKSKAQLTVDNAHMRYFIVHMHKLLEPGLEE